MPVAVFAVSCRTMNPSILDLDIGQLPATPFIPVGHSLRLPALPTLSPSRHDAGGRVRVLKDVLRVGKWKVGKNQDGTDRYWDVKPETLKEIASEFQGAQSRGVARNLIWGHGDPVTKIVDPRDIIAPVDQAVATDEALWVSSYVTKEQAAELSNPAHKVSIRAATDHTEGDGTKSPLAMLHVGIVDSPVVSGQGPFVQLSQEEQRERLDFALSLFTLGDGYVPEKKPSDSQEGGDPESSGSLDPERTVNQVKELCQIIGVPLPETVTYANLNDALDILLPLMKGPEQDDQNPDANPTGDPTMQKQTPGQSNLSLSDVTKAVTDAIKPFETKITDLSNQVTALQSDKANAAKVAFETRLTDLASAGHIDAPLVEKLKAKGAKFQYDLELLDGYGDVSMIDLGSNAQRHASTKGPKIGKTRTDAEVKADLEARGVKYVEMPVA